MQTSADARRRWFGMLFLVLAGVLLLWGQTLLKPHLNGLAFVGYWLLCFLLTGAALLTAWLDLRAIRRRELEQQQELLRAVLRQIQRQPKGPRAPEDPPPTQGSKKD